MKASVAMLSLTLALVACGGSSSPKAGGSNTPTPSPSCTPSSTALTITARNLAFDKTCLATSAGQAFTIQLTNNDNGTTHNIAILTADPIIDPSAKKLFSGTQFAGVKTMTYNVAALAAGTYYFHCEIHPTQMTGDLIVS